MLPRIAEHGEEALDGLQADVLAAIQSVIVVEKHVICGPA